jgi:hypothetical protein
MTGEIPRPPTIRSILLGIILLVIAILAFIRIPDVVKYAGSAVMYLPAKLGLFDMVSPQEVTPVSIRENPSTISFPEAGQYALFTDNYNLLVIHDAVMASNAEPWVKIESDEFDTQVEMIMIERGLAWYDTPFARGRPIFTFQIDQPGTYDFIHPARKDHMYLVPDTVTGQEGLITFWVVAEISLVAAVLTYVYRKRNAGMRRRRSDVLAQNRARVQDTWEKIEKQAEEKRKEKDLPYWKKR